MPLFGPDPMWARTRPTFRRLLLAALALAVMLALAPAARAQEAPPVVIEQPPGPAADVPVDPAPPPDPAPVVPEPAPDPPPPPDVPSAPLESQVPESPPSAPVEDHSQPATRPEPEGNRGASSPASPPPAATAAPSFTAIAGTPPAGPSVPEPAATTAPLGWDVYDDALFAERLDGGAGLGGFGGSGPPTIGSFHTFSSIASAAQRNTPRDAKPPSHAEAVAPGGGGGGGSGFGQGPSPGLFGAAGGAGAGMALMTLLGMACGWALFMPGRARAFLTSTATWRLSAYVPPIEHPG
jgi:hypothetical protein